MRHEEWRDLEAERLRRLRDRDGDRPRDREDFGQADYSDLYGYDARHRTGYRAYDDGQPRERQSFVDDREPRRPRRDGPSDRVLWAVISERLEDERRLDLRDVEVIVQDQEVTLNGTVRHKHDKRRIEDVADIEGVRHVQNNLRVREGSRWTLF
ncbi:BON domain-containing protein [uncultured Phenylobacterium sp.]|uniref:BON domain-containing protein n=1 Tax=uncultured Phenylobacterium sp. TaxID=349273 RepID=UPI0025CFD479|nr:BON domain-containing protein [uncultured Phenylobacterium sp.]